MTLTNKSGYPYNLVNMHAFKGKEEEVRKIDEVNIVVPETKIVREFDIVSNNQYKNNEEFQRAQTAIAKSVSMDKLVKRVINPVTMTYFNAERDRNDHQSRINKHLKQIAQKESHYPDNYK